MGKYLLIKNADFSENSAGQVKVKKYLLNLPDSLLNGGDSAWLLSAAAFADENQDKLSGKTINGIRLNVVGAGTVTIFKATKPVSGLTDSSSLTQVATASTYVTGIQDLEFSSPVVLGPDECLVIAKTSDTLLGKFHQNNSLNPSPFYARVGTTGIVRTVTGASFDVDYFQYLNP